MIIADKRLNRYIKMARHTDVSKKLSNCQGDESYITVFSFLITWLNTDSSNYRESKVVHTIQQRYIRHYVIFEEIVDHSYESLQSNPIKAPDNFHYRMYAKNKVTEA